MENLAKNLTNEDLGQIFRQLFLNKVVQQDSVNPNSLTISAAGPSTSAGGGQTSTTANGRAETSNNTNQSRVCHFDLSFNKVT